MNSEIKILAVDSEDIILKSIVKALKNDSNNKYIVNTCNTALEGLKLIRNDIFDLIFLDIVLPGMNGNEVFRRIKNIYPELPVVIMSGFSKSKLHSTESTTKNSMEEHLNNVAGFLLKPFTIKEILSLIHRILNLD
jgi:DNA-binding NtrC family response regulator